jgi:hypothetical protein
MQFVQNPYAFLIRRATHVHGLGMVFMERLSGCLCYWTFGNALGDCRLRLGPEGREQLASEGGSARDQPINPTGGLKPRSYLSVLSCNPQARFRGLMIIVPNDVSFGVRQRHRAAEQRLEERGERRRSRRQMDRAAYGRMQWCS